MIYRNSLEDYQGFVSVCVFNDQRVHHLFKNFAAFGILVPQPGIEPVPPAVESLCLNPWTTQGSPQ